MTTNIIGTLLVTFTTNWVSVPDIHLTDKQVPIVVKSEYIVFAFDGKEYHHLVGKSVIGPSRDKPYRWTMFGNTNTLETNIILHGAYLNEPQ